MNAMTAHNKRHVVKRNGALQLISFDKILTRIDTLCTDLDDVDSSLVAQKVIMHVKDGMSTQELDDVAAETASYMLSQTPQYGKLAARIAMSNLHKQTSEDWPEVVRLLRDHMVHGLSKPLVSDAFALAVERYGDALQTAIDYSRDYQFDYFGLRTLLGGYLLKVDNKAVERPQHMYMRVALGIQLCRHDRGAAPPEEGADGVDIQGQVASVDVDAVLRTYHALSQHLYTHASPTMFNAGTTHPQLASCFLLPVAGDSISEIYDTVKQCAVISKHAGGIGLNVSNVRGEGSPIYGTNGISNGLAPMLRVFQETAKYVDQCFPDSTRVHTRTGLRSFSALTDKDELLNSESRYAPVAKLLRHRDVESALGEAYLYGARQPMRVTDQHPIMVIKAAPNVTASVALGTRQAEYKCLEDIAVGDYAVFVVPQEQDPIAVRPEWMVLLGAIMAECIIRQQDLMPTEDIPFDFKGPARREPLIRLNTVANAVGADVLNEPLEDGVRATILYESMPSDLAAFLDGAYYSKLPKLNEEAYFIAFTAALEFLRPQYTPSYIVLGTPACVDMGAVAMLALRAGLVVHTGPTAGSGLVVLWGHKLYQWYLEQQGEPCEPRFIVPRVNNMLLVPFVRINLATQSCKHAVLSDLEMVSAPHDYVTEYGVVHNGGGKRRGSIAVYVEPWHADIMTFLHMKRTSGEKQLETRRARDLFYALWIPDLFMERVQADGTWSLFCPDAILPVKLQELHGAAFNEAYLRLEAEGKATKVLPAREVWKAVKECQMEQGVPYMLFKDAANAKSNQQNLGTIQCSNLCTEIIEYSSPDEVAVCNLASVALPKFVRKAQGAEAQGAEAQGARFDYAALMDTVRLMTANLNAAIDASLYPLPGMARSNLRHRPIGLGVQGLADVFFMLKLPYTSPEARAINRKIFKCIYYAATEQSVAEAQRHGAYSSFEGSPASQGRLQPDLWGVDPSADDAELGLDWDALRASVQQHGMRNSLLVAPMPTASTAQILGNVECFEAQTSNLYSRRVLSGNFMVVNKHLLADLADRGLWSDDMRRKIIAADGSAAVQGMPDDLREIYKTVWELPQRDIVDMAADRGPYIDQSQSLNIHFADPDDAKLNSLHFYAWRRGLKTGMYYLRSLPAAQPIKTTLGAPTKRQRESPEEPDPKRPRAVCTEEVCTMCSA